MSVFTFQLKKEEEDKTNNVKAIFTYKKHFILHKDYFQTIHIKTTIKCIQISL